MLDDADKKTDTLTEFFKTIALPDLVFVEPSFRESVKKKVECDKDVRRDR